jgi:hypothetical protein
LALYGLEETSIYPNAANRLGLTPLDDGREIIAGFAEIAKPTGQKRLTTDRAFAAGTAALFRAEGLGEPGVGALSLLSEMGGLEKGDSRQRWQEKLRRFREEEKMKNLRS